MLFDVIECFIVSWLCFVFFQAEDGIRDLVRSRGLGDVYKRQVVYNQQVSENEKIALQRMATWNFSPRINKALAWLYSCLLYTSDAADERSSVDLGGRRIIKKKQT